ncbi:MAG: NrsF family protein, partial [Pseudorhizobium sp.]
NDGFTFVALWYTTAIAITASIGAVLGPRALRW